MPISSNGQQASLKYEISSEAGGKVCLRFTVEDITREEMEHLQRVLEDIGVALLDSIEGYFGKSNVDLAHPLKPRDKDWQIFMELLIRCSHADEVRDMMEKLAPYIEGINRTLREEL